MPTIHVSAECAAPVEQVFDYIADYRTMPEWFYGVKSWEPLTEETRGVGARFAVAVSLGLTIKSTVELQEYVENELMVIDSVEGFPNSSRWHFSPSPTGTLVECEFSYEFPGGIAGKAMAKVVEPVVKIAVAHATKEFTQRAPSHTPGP